MIWLTPIYLSLLEFAAWWPLTSVTLIGCNRRHVTSLMNIHWVAVGGRDNDAGGTTIAEHKVSSIDVDEVGLRLGKTHGPIDASISVFHAAASDRPTSLSECWHLFTDWLTRCWDGSDVVRGTASEKVKRHTVCCWVAVDRSWCRYCQSVPLFIAYQQETVCNTSVKLKLEY